MFRFLGCALLAIGCTTPTSASDDDLVGLIDPKADQDGLAGSLGMIVSGQDPIVDYTGAPPFRAFTFDATEGDLVSADVFTVEGDHLPTVWILDAELKILRRADPLPDTTFAQADVTIPAGDPRHYFVFKERHERDTRFGIHFAHRLGGPTECTAAPRDNPIAGADTEIAIDFHARKAETCSVRIDGFDFGAFPCTEGAYRTTTGVTGTGEHELVFTVANATASSTCATRILVE